jgi:hypothetical protein
MSLNNLWIFVIPSTAIFLIQLIVRLFQYVKKTDFIRFAILLHVLQLIWHISALFTGIPSSPESFIILKFMRYVMVFIPSALVMVALSLDENYKLKPFHLWIAFAPPLFFYIVLNLSSVTSLMYGNFFLALVSASPFYRFSLLLNMVYYFAFVMIMMMNMDRFYRLSKHRDFYLLLSIVGSILPVFLTYLVNFGMPIKPDAFSIFVPIMTIMLYFAMEFPRLRYFDSVQLSNRINIIDYPIAIYDLKGRRQGFNIAFRSDIYPHADFRKIDNLEAIRMTQPIVSIKGRHFKATCEDLFNEGKQYATAVYFDDITELRKNILEHEEKVRKLDALNDQLLEDMVIQEKLILETNRQVIFTSIQSQLVESYQTALDRLHESQDEKTLDEVTANLQGTLAQLRIKVKELRTQAEEIMDIGRLIETCVTLYDPQRMTIKIEPSPDLKVLTFAQASAIYLAVRQILDFASLQPQCYAADIVLQKERGRPVLVTGLQCTKRIEDHLVAEFEKNVFLRGPKKSDGMNIMNSDTGCIIYAVLEP